MVKNVVTRIMAMLSLISVSALIFAGNHRVYTIGAYDEAFKRQETVMKLGPLLANDVPPTLPKTFLEADGGYAGGEAYPGIALACAALVNLLASGVLPANETWHIYLLDADWERDTYKLRGNDFRMKRLVKVLMMVKERCD